MNALVEEWIDKAEEDYLAANLLLETIEPIPSVVAFHCQQRAEKYLKALLTLHQIEFARTHSLTNLRRLIETFDADIADIDEDLELIADYAVEVRYPGSGATQSEALEAFEAVTRI